jgi:hypothetical protein
VMGLEEIVEAVAVRIWADFAGSGRRKFCAYCESPGQVDVLRELLSHCVLGKNSWGPGEGKPIFFDSGIMLTFQAHELVLGYAPGYIGVREIREQLGRLAREAAVAE